MTFVKKGAHRASAAVMPGLCGRNQACSLQTDTTTSQSAAALHCSSCCYPVNLQLPQILDICAEEGAMQG